MVIGLVLGIDLRQTKPLVFGSHRLQPRVFHGKPRIVLDSVHEIHHLDCNTILSRCVEPSWQESLDLTIGQLLQHELDCGQAW